AAGVRGVRVAGGADRRGGGVGAAGGAAGGGSAVPPGGAGGAGQRPVRGQGAGGGGAAAARPGGGAATAGPGGRGEPAGAAAGVRSRLNEPWGGDPWQRIPSTAAATVWPPNPVRCGSTRRPGCSAPPMAFRCLTGPITLTGSAGRIR